jgi:hypothetical protein
MRHGTHVYTSHRHYYSFLLSINLPFFLAGWLYPINHVGYISNKLSHVGSLQLGTWRNVVEFIVQSLHPILSDVYLQTSYCFLQWKKREIMTENEKNRNTENDSKK